jgi:HD-like signal output (HDOD) protein
MHKRVLFLATDPAERENIRIDLTGAVQGLEKSLVDTFDEAVAAIQAAPPDAIVADHQARDPSSAKLLNWAAEHCPRAVRLILAEPTEREEVLRTVLAPHQFLPKPVTADILHGTIQSALLLNGELPNEVLLTLASRIRVFPPLPSLYFRVLNELKSPDFSAETVGEIVAKDLAMTTRLLQVINSGFYSLPRRITDLTEAVSLLGQESVKSLIIGIHLFLEHEHLKPLYFSISQLWRHSTAVARGAWLIAQMETGNADLTEEAYTAGLLHDIGKLVLANNFEAQYNKVQKAARDSRQPLWEVETGEFGVSHAELGAFIMGRWGMPVVLLEATALHHQPRRSSSREFSALTAVHIANAIEYELRSPQRDVLSILDQSYIESLGLADRIDEWKQCFREGKIPSGKRVAAAGAADRSASAAKSQNAQLARSRSRSKLWLPTASIIGVTASLGWYLSSHWPDQELIPAHAKPRPGENSFPTDSTDDTNGPAISSLGAGENAADSLIQPFREAPSASEPEGETPEQ